MRTSAVLLATFIALSMVGCKAEESARAGDSGAGIEATSTGDPAVDANTAVLWVHGMACPQCAHNVDLQLLKVPGVESVKIDMGSGRVNAQLSATDPPTRDQLAKAIEETGFTLKKIEMP